MPDRAALSARALQLSVLFAIGLLGALAAQAVGLPIPYLLGSLIATSAISLVLFAHTGRRLWYPQPLRLVFVGTIGAMIGSTFTPEILSFLPAMKLTLLALIGFVFLAQGVGFLVYRHLGQYDPVTATYAAMPGGLIEAVSIGEQAGGDVEILSLQHFARIILVVMTVPALFYFWTGEVVGSAAGQSMSDAPSHWEDWALFLILVPLGAGLGKLLHLPAGPLTGPILLTAVAQGSGLIDLAGPPVLLNCAQLGVGVGLGAMFARSTPMRLLKGFLVGIVAVGLVMALSAGFAALCARYVDMGFGTLFLSFAPGGVTEMSLIALSLGISPVLVSAHHLFRIFATVMLAGVLSHRTRSE